MLCHVNALHGTLQSSKISVFQGKRLTALGKVLAMNKSNLYSEPRLKAVGITLQQRCFPATLGTAKCCPVPCGRGTGGLRSPFSDQLLFTAWLLQGFCIPGRLKQAEGHLRRAPAHPQRSSSTTLPGSQCSPNPRQVLQKLGLRSRRSGGSSRAGRQRGPALQPARSPWLEGAAPSFP